MCFEKGKKIMVVVKQVVRKFVKTTLEEWNPPFGTISSVILLLIIYTTFCDTFKSKVKKSGRGEPIECRGERGGKPKEGGGGGGGRKRERVGGEVKGRGERKRLLTVCFS